MRSGAFSYEALPVRVIFGVGAAAALPQEVDRLGLQRVMVISTAGRADQGRSVAKLLSHRVGAVCDAARMHTPVAVTEQVLATVERERIDGLVAVGGGSAIGLAKAVALRTDLPQIAIPTTYAGSEATPIIGQTQDGIKTTQRSLRVLPEVVVYDVDLTLGLPVAVSVASGMNAMAHAAEALYAQDGNPVIDLLAEEAVRRLVRALPLIVADPTDRAARSDALYGAWLCGTCLGAVGMSLHHKLCHTLGGGFGLPHAETHSVILPHALAYNLAAAPQARERLARAIGADDPAGGLHRLALTLGAPTSLQLLGLPAEAIDEAADLAMRNPYWNPRPFDRAALRALLARAWAGAAPCAD